MTPTLTARLRAVLTPEVRDRADFEDGVAGDAVPSGPKCIELAFDAGHAAWADVLLAAIAPVVEPPWQDISTAPKDDLEILLSDGQQVWTGLRSRTPAKSYWESPDGEPLYIAFTHWQPLPLPPATEPRA